MQPRAYILFDKSALDLLFGATRGPVRERAQSRSVTFPLIVANAVTPRHMPSPSIEVGALHQLSADDARALVDLHLGPPASWPQQLPGWRLGHPSQDDWKVEVGQILHTATAYDYLSALLPRLHRAKREHERFIGKRLANDKSHLDLMAELAPAMAVHYFAGTGWAFWEWEPTTKLVDVDVELLAPSGQRVAVQVKAPDEPAGYDERVFAALEHGRQQLEGAEQPSMLVVCAQRGYSLAAHPDIVLDHLLGLTTEVAGTVYLPIEALGRFATERWRHIGAVVFLEHLRGGERSLYTCSVLLNPWADERVRCEREWFPRARVCWREGDWLNWQAAPPHGEIYKRIRIARRWWR